MAIIFENIDTKETYGISSATEGKYSGAKLSALINSSNLSINADRGQDFGYRLIPEQQAVLELWEQDFDMIDKVSNFTHTPVDNLSHVDFLSYMLYQQEAGKKPENAHLLSRRENQSEYDKRVQELLNSTKVEAVPAFESPVKRGEETLEDFLSGELTGDASGDKAEEKTEAAPKKPSTKK